MESRRIFEKVQTEREGRPSRVSGTELGFPFPRGVESKRSTRKEDKLTTEWVDEEGIGLQRFISRGSGFTAYYVTGECSYSGEFFSLRKVGLSLMRYGLPKASPEGSSVARKRVPLSEVSVNREAENNLSSAIPLKVSASETKGDDENQSLFSNIPFLTKISRKKRGTFKSSDAGMKDQVDAIAAETVRTGGTRLFQEGECNSVLRLQRTQVLRVPRTTTIANDLLDPIPKERFMGKMTFANEFSIMGHKLGVEKMNLEGHIARMLDTSSATNDGNAVEPKPAMLFVFQTCGQEETKPRRSRAAKGNSDLRNAVTKAKAKVAGTLKQEEFKARNIDLKVKSDPKLTCGSSLFSSYLKPSKRARLITSVSKTPDDTKCILGKFHSSSAEAKLEAAETFEFPASSSEEFRSLELPEWAKIFKRKQEETLFGESSTGAGAPDESFKVDDIPDESAKVATTPSPGLSMSPLKKIEDRVDMLLDRLKSFWGEAHVEAVRPAA
ncbi:hypothetical protein R1flu_018194 [Riccia fluitans]|uniref:Uncharacterized protein n=1 Tax=Riccia fluitans TaxID=41844 RepID=A0ABD1ZGJ6_9MARC